MKNKLAHHHVNFYVGLIVIACLITLFQFHAIVSADRYIAFALYNYFGNPYITYFFALITDFTLGSIYAPVATTIYLLYKKKKSEVLFFLLSYATLVLFRQIIQILVARQRPFMIYLGHPYLGQSNPLGYSFPSFHATTAFFLAYILSTLLKLKPTAVAVLFTLAFVVAVTRVYLGAHYPLDVLAGSSLGLLWGYGSYHFFWKYFRSAKN